jgi:hypothetical protein
MNSKSHAPLIWELSLHTSPAHVPHGRRPHKRACAQHAAAPSARMDPFRRSHWFELQVQ